MKFILMSVLILGSNAGFSSVDGIIGDKKGEIKIYSEKVGDDSYNVKIVQKKKDSAAISTDLGEFTLYDLHRVEDKLIEDARNVGSSGFARAGVGVIAFIWVLSAPVSLPTSIIFSGSLYLIVSGAGMSVRGPRVVDSAEEAFKVGLARDSNEELVLKVKYDVVTIAKALADYKNIEIEIDLD